MAAAATRCGEEGGAAAMSGAVASIVGRADAGGNPATSEGAEAATGHRRAARRSQEARRAVRAQVGSETRIDSASGLWCEAAKLISADGDELGCRFASRAFGAVVAGR